MEVQTTKEMVAVPLSNKKKHCEVLINAFQLSFSVLQTFSVWILPSWIPKKMLFCVKRKNNSFWKAYNSDPDQAKVFFQF